MNERRPFFIASIVCILVSIPLLILRVLALAGVVFMVGVCSFLVAFEGYTDASGEDEDFE